MYQYTHYMPGVCIELHPGPGTCESIYATAQKNTGLKASIFYVKRVRDLL